jgi:prepilin signal peptidase PulO-like enzyme (type II secretory pathway)
MAGSFAGLVVGVPYTWIRGKLSPMATYLPLGTFLAMGAALTYFWGDALLGWYMGFLV